MGDDHNLLAGMVPRQFFEATHHPNRALTETFALGDHIIHVARQESLILARLSLLNFTPGQPLKNSEVPLAQPRIRRNWMSGRSGNQFRRMARPAKITTEKRSKRAARQPCGQRLSLGESPGIQRAIGLPLKLACVIPNRFAMPHNDQPG